MKKLGLIAAIAAALLTIFAPVATPAPRATTNEWPKCC